MRACAPFWQPILHCDHCGRVFLFSYVMLMQVSFSLWFALLSIYGWNWGHTNSTILDYLLTTYSAVQCWARSVNNTLCLHSEDSSNDVAVLWQMASVTVMHPDRRLPAIIILWQLAIISRLNFLRSQTRVHQDLSQVFCF